MKLDIDKIIIDSKDLIDTMTETKQLLIEIKDLLLDINFSPESAVCKWMARRDDMLKKIDKIL